MDSNVKYKDSGSEWIGEIPSTWNIGRIGQLYIERKQKVSDRDYPPLSVTMSGIVPQLDTAAKSDAHDDRKLVLKGDFAINSRSDRRGSCGISAYDGSVSLINTVLKPKGDFSPDYYGWLFKSTMFSDEYYKWGHGIVDDLWTTNWQDMKKIVIPIPSLSEQERIASFLNKKCNEIDNIICSTENSIGEYRKLKQSIITEAVMRGVRGERKTKNSGIEWFRDIPYEWSVNKIKNVSIFNPNCKYIENDAMVTYTPMENIKNGYFIDNSIEKAKVPASLISYENGDIVLAKVTPCFENMNIALMDNLSNGIGYGSSELFVLRPTNIFADYLFYWLQNFYFIDMGIATMTGTGGLKRVSPYYVKNSFILVPPKDEQEEISEYIEKKCRVIDNLIAVKKKIIAELELYRQSIVYEYVTGKKEVSEL